MAKYRTAVMVAADVAGDLEVWCAARDTSASVAVAEGFARWLARPGPAAAAPGPRIRLQLRIDRRLVEDVRAEAAHQVVGLGAVADTVLRRMMQQPAVVDPRA